MEPTELQLAIAQARDLQQQLDRERETVQRQASTIAEYERMVASSDTLGLCRLAGLRK
jgi:hypothetical protein